MGDEGVLFLADWAAYNGHRDVVTALMKSLEEKGGTVNPDSAFAKRTDFTVFQGKISTLDYKVFDGFNVLYCYYDDLYSQWYLKTSEFDSKWFSFRCKILIQKGLSILQHCIVETAKSDRLLSEVTFKPTFVYADYVGSIDEVFNIDAKNDYEAKVIEKEKQKILGITKGLGKKFTMDSEKVAALFYDYSLENFQQEMLSFIRTIEHKVLPPPVLNGRYDGKAVPESSGNIIVMKSPDWSDSQMEEEGPYAAAQPTFASKVNIPKQGLVQTNNSKQTPAVVPNKIVSNKTIAKPAANVDRNTKEATVLKQTVDEFQKKSDKHDPLHTIMNTPTMTVDASNKRVRKAPVASPILEDYYSDEEPVAKKSAKGGKTAAVPKKGAPATVVEPSRASKLTSPSRKGSKVQFDTQDSVDEYVSDAIESPSRAIQQVKKFKVGEKQDVAPAHITPPKASKKIIQETETNVIVSGDNDGSSAVNRVKWSLEEEELLIDAINTHGVGNWRAILCDAQYELLHSRTNINLKDKYRNMVKKGKL